MCRRVPAQYGKSEPLGGGGMTLMFAAIAAAARSAAAALALLTALTPAAIKKGTHLISRNHHVITSSFFVVHQEGVSRQATTRGRRVPRSQRPSPRRGRLEILPAIAESPKVGDPGTDRWSR